MDQGEVSYRRFLDGDDSGLYEIVDLYYDGLTLYLSAYVKDFHLAEDLAEEALAKLAVKKPRFNGRSSFKTWLYRIGRNLATDHMRRRKTDKLPLDDCAELASDEDIEQNYLREERKILLHRAMKGLTAEYRQVLWLYYFEDLGYREIAEIMGKSEDSVKHLASRAKNQLKSALDQQI